MTLQLSWDLHVHPGPSSVPRWGTAAEIRAAASRAGIAGFVWKSHGGHTARAARELPTEGPRVIGSASLNGWATPDDVWAAIADGARWIWGPSRHPGHGDRGEKALADDDWDLELPAWWPALLAGLPRTEAPLVFATGHLGTRGRLDMADDVARLGHLCSVTHARFLDPAEVPALLERDCRFELDLLTAVQEIRKGRWPTLADILDRLRVLGARVYLTTDAGQAATGDPYRFSERILAEMADQVGEATMRMAAVVEPDELARATIAASADIKVELQ